MAKAKMSSEERAKAKAKASQHAEKRYGEGLRDGQHDIAHALPLRKATGKTDPYAKGYRAGVAIGRTKKKISGK